MTDDRCHTTPLPFGNGLQFTRPLAMTQLSIYVPARDLRVAEAETRRWLTESGISDSLVAVDRDLTPCVGHAESRKVGGGSEMIHHDGKEKLP